MTEPRTTPCPLCARPAAEGAAECASCGVIFAKLEARAERQKAASAPPLEPTPPPALDPWHVRLAAAAVVVCWMIGLGLYYRIELSRSPLRAKPLALQGRSTVTVRDSYGLVGEVPVATARRVAAGGAPASARGGAFAAGSVRRVSGAGGRIC